MQHPNETGYLRSTYLIYVTCHVYFFDAINDWGAKVKQRSIQQNDRIARRRMREEQNLISRMPAVYAASRLQGQRLLQAAGGLSIVEWRVLWDLAEAGPMTIGEMAQIQRIDHSQLSRALPNMRAKGFVLMRPNDRDGRQVLVDIAPAGLAAYEKARPTMQRRRAFVKAAFSEAEIKQFINLLDRYENLCREPIEQITDQEPKND
jgi:DNA-binding MarR family transcriptional regulator